MAEVDISSYPKPALPVSPLEIAGKLGGLQQQQLAISQAKLDQANQGLTYLTRAMISLGPNATKEQYKEVGANAVKMGLVPENMLNVWNERVDASPDSPTFFKQALAAASEHQQILKLYQGVPSTLDSGAKNYQGTTDIMTGGFTPATEMNKTVAPTTPTVNQDLDSPNYMQPGYVGPAGPPGVRPYSGLPVAAPAAAAAPAATTRRLPVEPPAPLPSGPVTNPAIKGPSSNFGGTVVGANVEKPSFIPSGPPPMFEEGKKTLMEAQLRASGLNQTNKPAIQALNILKDVKLATGPGTGQINDLMAGLKAFGLVDTKLENDPTAARQELEKKLAQFVSNSPIAGRSDAAQVLAEASYPNPKKQILPALVKLTRDAIALNRVEAAKALTFKGNDYAQVGTHFANFPQSVDERAFGLDLMDTKDRDALIKKMANQYKNGDARQKKEADKFLNSLQMSKQLGFYE